MQGTSACTTLGLGMYGIMAHAKYHELLTTSRHIAFLYDILDQANHDPENKWGPIKHIRFELTQAKHLTA